MAKRRKTAVTPVDNRSGGVYIGKEAKVEVGGDLVGRDKITLNQPDTHLDQLFTKLLKAITDDQDLTDDEKQESIAKSEKLKDELNQLEPDLGKISGIKKFLVDKGGFIATAVGAIFQYPPVQEIIKNLAQKLMGG